MLTIGVPREATPGETRVALIPELASRLVRSGFRVVVESRAGERAGHPDTAYSEAGATLATARELFPDADIVLKVLGTVVRPDDGFDETASLRPGAVLIGFLDPARNAPVLARLGERGVTAFAMERVPRITRAQKMDALSSMSTVAGYKAALLGADTLGKFFPLLMTAAGTIAPAKVLVLGAGVAGLQAIATSRRLGAVVEAFDVRPAVRDEIKSLGATFVGDELTSDAAVGAGGYARAVGAEQEAKIRDMLHRHVKGADVVITTANVPGRRAPVLVTAAMVRDMRPGSVIVDLAAESGGNCELTRPGATAVESGVTIHGPVHLVAQLPVHASQMYSRNVYALLLHLTKGAELALDWTDEITRDTCVTAPGREPAATPTAAATTDGAGTAPATAGAPPLSSPTPPSPETLPTVTERP